MGTFSDNIRAAMAQNFVSGRKNTAANARAVVGTIADAVAALEDLQRGARILSGAGVPANTTGLDGDAYINTSVSDLYLKSAGAWSLRLVLRGQNGASAYQSWLNAGNAGSELAFVLSLRGQDGRSAYQSWQLAGNAGSEVEFVASLAGRSAYQSWLATGNVGTEAQFVASLKAKNGEPGQRGNRITANAIAPTSGGGLVNGPGGDLDVVGDNTTFTDRLPGDLHFQTLSADCFRLWYQDRGTWIALYTTPAGATVGDKSITAAKMADDVAIGSISAAQNAYPAADRAGLISVEKFLVWIGGKTTDLISRVGSVETGLGTLSTLVNGFAARISALEARPVGTTGGGTGSGFTPTTGGDGTKYLSDNGTYKTIVSGSDFTQVTGDVKFSGNTTTIQPGAVSADKLSAGLTTIIGNKVDAVAGKGLSTNDFSNTLKQKLENLNTKYAADYALGQGANPPAIDFRVTTQITLIGRTSSIASVNYSINNGAPQPLVFTNNIDSRGITVPAGGQLAFSSITYSAGFTSGTLFIEGTQA